jgi:hypothetical protein
MKWYQGAETFFAFLLFCSVMVCAHVCSTATCEPQPHAFPYFILVWSGTQRTDSQFKDLKANLAIAYGRIPSYPNKPVVSNNVKKSGERGENLRTLPNDTRFLSVSEE